MAKEPIYLNFLKIPLKYSGWLLLASALALASYLTFTSYLTAGTVAVDEILHQINLKLDQGSRVQFRLNSAEGKPIIYDKNDFEILQYDYKSSTLEVDGVRKNLWEGTFNYSVDRRGKRVFYTTSFPFEKDSSSFLLLEEVVSFENPETVKVEYYFTFTRKPDSNYAAKEVKLNLAHLPLTAFVNLEKRDTGVAALSLATPRRNKGLGITYIPFEAKLEGNLDKIEEISIGDKKGFTTQYRLKSTGIDRRELVAREMIKLGKMR